MGSYKPSLSGPFKNLLAGFVVEDTDGHESPFLDLVCDSCAAAVIRLESGFTLDTIVQAAIDHDCE